MFLAGIGRNEDVKAFYSTGPHWESCCNCRCILFSFISGKAGKVAVEAQIFARDTVKLWGDCFFKKYSPISTCFSCWKEDDLPPKGDTYLRHFCLLFKGAGSSKVLGAQELLLFLNHSFGKLLKSTVVFPLTHLGFVSYPSGRWSRPLMVLSLLP